VADKGFVTSAQRALLETDAEPSALLARLADSAAKATRRDDYRRI
jgi:hypothetical protein